MPSSCVEISRQSLLSTQKTKKQPTVDKPSFSVSRTMYAETSRLQSEWWIITDWAGRLLRKSL